MKRCRSSLLIALILVLAGACGESNDDKTRAELQRDNLSPEAQRFLLESESAFKAGQYRIALALSDSVEAHAPDLADLHFLRGRIYTALNQFEIADAAYESALEVDPKYPGAHMNLGVNYVRRGALRDAVAEFTKEEAIQPKSNLSLEKGRAYARLGEPDSARMAYERAIELDSTNATAMMWLGQLYEELGEFDRALEFSRRGSSLRPDNLDYKYIIGSQLFRTGAVDEAVTYLRPVADERPWHHGAQYNMGQALIRMGEEGAAQDYLAQADRAQQMQQRINEAQEAIERDPDDVRHWIQLADVHRSAGMFERALDAMRSAVAMAPDDLDLHINLATLLMESGDSDAAIARYQAILDRDSTLTKAWLNLGVAYGNAGRHDEARRAWESALETDPGNRQARSYLAQLRQLSTAR